jgi:phosphatidylglycerophosphate synthase
MVPSGIFAAASVTDYLDGYLARRWDISSDFGAFLDPVVSKDNFRFHKVTTSSFAQQLPYSPLTTTTFMLLHDDKTS